MNRQSPSQRRALAKLERKADEARERFAKTKSEVALVRMRDAVTKALRASLRSERTLAGRSAQ